jgi:hypothetical protein
LGVGHEADNLIMEKVIMLRSPKKRARMITGNNLANEERKRI